MMRDMEFHPLADVFPLIEGGEFAELVSSILARGQLEKIITYEGRILDGRNRYLACKQAGVTPVFEGFEGTFEEARDHVVDSNLRRRHLDVSQRAMIAARLATLRDGQRQLGKFAYVPTQAKAAERFGVSARSVRDAVKVRDHGAPELVTAVERGEVPVSRAVMIAVLPKEEQSAALAKPKYDLASPSDPPARESARPLRNLENISGGGLARWIKITTPNDRPHVVRVLEMAAAILRDELETRQKET
jgi:ParB-like chromosome segregation protein Spo0J